MSEREETGRRARKPNREEPVQDPMDVRPQRALPSLAIRLEASYDKHITALEADKEELAKKLEAAERLRDKKIDELRDQIDRLAPENARLLEALDAERTYNLVSTVLNTVGGVLIGYATFTGKLSERIAAVGLGLVSGAVILQIFGKVRHWLGSRKGT